MQSSSISTWEWLELPEDISPWEEYIMSDVERIELEAFTSFNQVFHFLGMKTTRRV
jgi:hypothetical protein